MTLLLRRLVEERIDASIVIPACSSEALFTAGLTTDEQCTMAMEHCESASLINFYKLYFCTLATSDLLFYPIAFFTLIFAFYLMSLTADEFLAPCTQEISQTFRLSESLAGVTILAFGAGAPDVLSSIMAASGSEIEGVEMAIAVLVGSSLFIISVVNSVTIFFSPRAIVLNRVFFTRDAIFLLVSLLVLLYSVVIRGCIDIAMSITFLVLYVLYVLAVFYQDRVYEQEANSEVAQKAALAVNMIEMDQITNFGSKPKENNNAASLNGEIDGSDASDSLMSYDFENQFRQESSAYYYIDNNQQSSSYKLGSNGNQI